MTHSPPTSKQRVTSTPAAFVPRLRPVAAACLTVIASMSLHAQQAAEPTKVDQVVITGIRASIESSIATKRNSDSIVESVSAEDIGKLPDTSIAESLARLPGLTAQRVDGRASVISIRGMNAGYAGALLNGREVVSSGDSRAAEYDQFPSELINKATVYKTPDAALIGQGLSGTIDAQTIMPLDVRGRKIALNLRGEHNSNGKLTPDGNGANGNRFSVSYIDQFADNTVGVALGYAHLDTPGQEQYYQAWRFGDYNNKWGAGAVGVPTVGAGPDKAQYFQGFDAGVTSSKQVRDGLLGVLEFKPNKDFHSVLDLYYSKFDQDRVRHMLQGDFLWGSAPATFSNVGTSLINGNTVITSGAVSNARSLIRNDNSQRSDAITALGWKNELKLGNKWAVAADLSYSKSERDETWIETYSQPSQLGTYTFSGLGIPGGQTWSVNQDLSSTSLVKINDSHGWGVIRTPHITDEIKSMRLTAKRELGGIFSNVDLGANYTERDKTVNRLQNKLVLAGPTDVPAGALRSPTDLSFAGINTKIVSFDVPSIMNLFTYAPTNPWEEKDNHYSMHEKVTTAYVKFNIDTDLGAVPVRGNIGLQAVHTQQRSDGFAWVNDKIYPVSGGKNYNDYLPSLNLVFDLKNDVVARFGLARVMARPNMGDLRAGADQPKVNTDPSSPNYRRWSASNGGNPNLEPWRADSVDLSFEKYFGKRSYVAVAGFYKDLKTFIYNQTVERDFTGFPNASGVTPITNIGTITAPANGNGGEISGIELSASLEGALFSKYLDGFGVVASLSNTSSSLHEANNPNRSLDGLSGMVSNLTLYYEKNGFSARVSQRYRSSYEATTRGVLLNNETSKISAERQVDMQLGYAFETGRYKGLSILFQVNNLTNTPYQTFRGSEVVGAAGNTAGLMPWVTSTYGRTMLLGVNYKL